MQKLKRCFLILAFLTVITSASQGQADQVAELQNRLEKARVEEAAAKANWDKELKAFEKAQAAYQASLKTSKPLGPPIQVHEKKARADFDAATKKRATLEAELAKAKAAAATQVAGTPTPAPSPGDSDQVRVPDLSGLGNVTEMKAILAHAGLTGAFSAVGKTPSKEKEFKFAAQSPAADTRVKRGSTVSVSIYQKFEGDSGDEVVVPNLSVFDSVEEMKAVLAHAGLTGAFAAKGKPPSKEKEFKFAAQSPPADSKVKRGSTVTVTIYQAFDAATEATDTVPALIGKTLEQATQTLSGVGLSIGGVDNSAKTDKQDKVNTIYEQSPGAGSKMPGDKLVQVKLYGSLASKGTPPPSNPLDEMIPGSDKELLGEFEGQAVVTTFDMSDYKREHPKETSQPVKIGIWRDANGQWHFSGRISGGSGIGEHGGGTTTVSGGVLTFEQHSGDWDRVCTVKVSGNQLVGTCQNTQKGATTQLPPINFTATRTK